MKTNINIIITEAQKKTFMENCQKFSISVQKIDLQNSMFGKEYRVKLEGQPQQIYLLGLNFGRENMINIMKKEKNVL